MSAFMVNRHHVDAMVRLGLDGPSGYHGGPAGQGSVLSWFDGEPTTMGEYDAMRRELRIEDADRVGAMLWASNLASIEARYPDTVDGGDYPGPLDFTRDDVLTYSYPGRFGHVGRAPTAVEGLSIIACFEYQACEYDGWRRSEARAYCEALTGKLIRCLPGYSEAPWEWEPVRA